jgi:hypothetical protein
MTFVDDLEIVPSKRATAGRVSQGGTPFSLTSKGECR